MAVVVEEHPFRIDQKGDGRGRDNEYRLDSQIYKRNTLRH